MAQHFRIVQSAATQVTELAGLVAMVVLVMLVDNTSQQVLEDFNVVSIIKDSSVLESCAVLLKAFVVSVKRFVVLVANSNMVHAIIKLGVAALQEIRLMEMAAGQLQKKSNVAALLVDAQMECAVTDREFVGQRMLIVIYNAVVTSDLDLVYLLVDF